MIDDNYPILPLGEVIEQQIAALTAGQRVRLLTKITSEIAKRQLQV